MLQWRNVTEVHAGVKPCGDVSLVLEFRVYAVPDRLKAELQTKGEFKLIHYQAARKRCLPAFTKVENFRPLFLRTMAYSFR